MEERYYNQLILMTVKGDNIKSAIADIYGLSANDLKEPQQLTHEQKVEGLLQRIVDTQGTGGGGTSATTIADGSDAALGARADTPATADTGTFSLISLVKRLLGKLQTGSQTVANSLSFALASNSPVQPATARTATTTVLTTGVTEASVVLTAAKEFSISCRNGGVDIRLDTTSGNTINTQNFTTIRSGQEYTKQYCNFTGTLFFSAEAIPSSTVVSCTTTSGSSTVTASSGAFSAITIGQLVTGTGVPATTFVIARNVAGSQITLGNNSGVAVNATASGTVTLTFSGAVVRVEAWI